MTDAEPISEVTWAEWKQAQAHLKEMGVTFSLTGPDADAALGEIERLRSHRNEGPILTALRAWLEEQIEPLAQDGTSRRKTWERGFIDGGVAAYRMVVIWLNRHAATTRAERVAEARRVLDFAWKGTTAFNKDSELTRTAEAYVASREKQ